MNVFEELRARAPIQDVVSRCSGMEDMEGKKARCVSGSHADNSPSMHVYDDHVHCFSCGFHGDVTDVWAAAQGFERPFEAALDVAREFGVELPDISPEARQRAKERREREETYLEQARARYRALEKHSHIREWWERRGFDEDLAERFALGANADGTAATIPYWRRGRVQCLIERRLEGEPKYKLPPKEELPDGHKPFFAPGSLSGPTFLVEGFIDALTLAALGHGAMAAGGTNISPEQMRELELIPGPLYILPDDDEEGAEAALRWVRQLYLKALLCPADYGEGRKDAADLFAAEGEAARVRLEDLKKRAADGLELATEAIPDVPSKRKKLKHVRENVMPLILRQLEEKGLAALLEPTKDSEVLAALDDVAAATKLKLSVLKAAMEEEAQRQLIKIASAAKAEKVAKSAADAVPEEAYAPLLAPGVLERYVKAAAKLHGVVEDGPALKLITLVAASAQLDLLPNRKPLGASTMLVADASRGKNFLTDAAVGLLPTDWYLAFESASAASMYYQVENDPDFLKHRFMYPNEAEATDMLVEFLRPMLSAGKAVRFTVNNTGPGGANEATELTVQGPITAIIPTIRNKLDEQLQTRLLVAELEDYEGRVKKHARAVSALLSPDYARADGSETARTWQAALRSLTGVRRVVFPLDREEFAFDNDAVSHGARLWANLLGLMCAHAWLEQHTREIIELASEARAIVATPDDYEAAYEVFKATCQRTVVNLSETHRMILNALYDLQDENPDADGFPQRLIAETAGTSQGTVAKNKAFLCMSVKLVKETDHGLALVSGAEPSWWDADGLMRGFPPPERVRSWWDEEHPPPDGPGSRDGRNTGNQWNTGNRREASAGAPERASVYGGNGASASAGSRESSEESPGITRFGPIPTDSGVIPERETAENRLSKGKPTDEPGRDDSSDSRYSSDSGVSRGEKNGQLTAAEVLEEINRSGSGPARLAEVYRAGEISKENAIEWVTKAILNRRGEGFEGWVRRASAVREVLEANRADKIEEEG